MLTCDDDRAGLPGTEEVLRLLRRASHQGEIVTLAYAQGSRPGQAKELKILEINPAEDRVMVLAVDVPAGTFAYPQEYRLSKVLRVRCIDGQHAENAVTAQHFAAFQARLKARDDAISDVRAGVPVTSNRRIRAAKLQAPTRGRRQADAWQLVLSSTEARSGTTTILLRRPDDCQNVCNALEFLADNSAGKVWEVLEVFVLAGVSWPSWWTYRNRLAVEGQSLRGTAPRLRDSAAVLNAQGTAGHTDYMNQLAHYRCSSLRPEDYEREGLAVDRVRLFEAEELDLSVLFRRVEPVPARAVGAYLTVATARGQMVGLPCEPVTAAVLHQLIEAGLVLPASKAPIRQLIQQMRASDLSAPLKARGVRLEASSLAAYRAFYATHMDVDYERALRDAPGVQNNFMLMPPQPWNWEALQDFRTCYVEMLRELARWVGGASVSCS